MPISVVLPNEVNMLSLKNALDVLAKNPKSNDPIIRLGKMYDQTIIYYNHTLSDKAFQTSANARRFGNYLITCKAVQSDFKPVAESINLVFKLSEARNFIDTLLDQFKGK